MGLGEGLCLGGHLPRGGEGGRGALGEGLGLGLGPRGIEGPAEAVVAGEETRERALGDGDGVALLVVGEAEVVQQLEGAACRAAALFAGVEAEVGEGLRHLRLAGALAGAEGLLSHGELGDGAVGELGGLGRAAVVEAGDLESAARGVEGVLRVDIRARLCDSIGVALVIRGKGALSGGLNGAV